MVTPSIHEQCWEPTTNLEHIRKCIQNGHHVMVIMRGIPGSGKSYLASDLVSGTNGAVFNTDKYFMQNGVYRFDPTKLDEYHQKNWKEAKDAIQQGIKPIIIDNTNIFVTHMKPYINLAVKNLYEIYFVEPETEWKKSAKECARRNAHSVPEEKIAYMAECFEKVSLTDVIKPTQLRTVPPLVDISDKDGTYNLLLSELDSALPGNHLDSLSGKDATDNKKSSEQLISLIPHQIPKNLRTIGCQTSDLVRVLDLSNPSSSANDEFVWEAVCDTSDFNYKKKMKAKATQAGDGNILSDIELLIAFFPDEKPSDLSHILEIAGLKNAMKLLKEMNAHMDICTPVDKNKNIDAESLSQTYYWWDESECEQIDNNNSPACVSNFELNRPISEKLAPCTYMQCCDPEPVPPGCYRMQISVDMMEQLTQLFGDGGSNTFLKTYVDLPVYLWRQIYFHWQGIPTTTTEVDNAFGSENFDFSALVNSDEELARILQDHELASYEFLENGKHMSIAERLQLSALVNDYSGVDRERVIECFRDNKFSAEATRNTLELFVNSNENIQTVAANPSHIESPPNQSGNCSVSAAFSRYSSCEESSVLKPDLELAHKEAFELREQAEWYDKQKHELLLRANNHRDFGAKMHYFAEAQKLGKKAKDCMAELNERLIKANTSTLFIDLHYMNVQSALKLLKTKLNAADRPPELRRGRSHKKLVVLTGYGKLNDGQAKIKPAVIQWLEQCGYEYYNTSNKGELVVECK
uniref:Smr domain-containing protein n=1 Tax=Wuchereria bancrofti TaxID=6293 RepID=A0A1I8F0A2_WUCBA